LFLHGAARVGVGIIWTLFELLIVAVVIMGRRHVKAGKSAPGTAATLSPRTAEKPPLREYKFDGIWTLSDARYTAPVRAVTPSGFTVTRPRCCEEGHATLDQAAEHAAKIKAEIERTGP
jgi:hypothetical protein